MVRRRRQKKDATWKNNPAVAAMAGLVIILVIIISLIVRAKTSPEARIKRARKTALITVQCVECEKVSRIKMGGSLDPPFKCSKCKKKKAFMIIECQNCTRTYLMKEKEFDDNPCPYCGKTVPTFYHGYRENTGD